MFASDILTNDAYLKGLSSKYFLQFEDGSAENLNAMQALYISSKDICLDMNDNRRKLPNKIIRNFEMIKQLGADSNDKALNIAPYMFFAGVSTYAVNPVNRRLFHKYMKANFKEGISLTDKLEAERPFSFNPFYYSTQVTLLESLCDLDYKLQYPSLMDELREKSTNIVKRPFIHTRFLSDFMSMFQMSYSPNKKYNIGKKPVKLNQPENVIETKEQNDQPCDVKDDEIKIQDVIKDCFSVVEQKISGHVDTLSGFKEIRNAKKLENIYKDYWDQSKIDVVNTGLIAPDIYIKTLNALSKISFSSKNKKVIWLGSAFSEGINSILELDKKELGIEESPEITKLKTSTRKKFDTYLSD